MPYESSCACATGARKTLSQPALQQGHDAGLKGASSIEGKCMESPPSFIRGKCQKNQKWKGQGSAYFEKEGLEAIYARGRY